jgi:hypothetical protein
MTTINSPETPTCCCSNRAALPLFPKRAVYLFTVSSLLLFVTTYLLKREWITNVTPYLWLFSIASTGIAMIFLYTGVSQENSRKTRIAIFFASPLLTLGLASGILIVLGKYTNDLEQTVMDDLYIGQITLYACYVIFAVTHFCLSKFK